MLPRVQGQPKATEWQNETLFKKKKKSKWVGRGLTVPAVKLDSLSIIPKIY